MARYTTEYGRLIETGFEPLLEALQSYPIYDESHRAELNEKILLRYKYREIGFETAARFAHYFKAMLFEIMPYYNKLYEVQAQKFNPLMDADYTEETDADSNGSASNANSGKSKFIHRYSDTPQGGFAFGTVTPETNSYMSEASVDDTDNSGQSSGSSNSHAEAIRTVKGKFPGRTYGEMLNDYKQAVWNIDTMILDDLNQCFMGVY